MSQVFVGIVLGVIIVAATIYFGRQSGIDSCDADSAQDAFDAVKKANPIDANVKANYSPIHRNKKAP